MEEKNDIDKILQMLKESSIKTIDDLIAEYSKK